MPINPLDRDFEMEEEDEELEDEGDIDLEIPRLDESQAIRMENEIVRRPVDIYNPGRIPGLGHCFFTTWGSQGIILHG